MSLLRPKYTGRICVVDLLPSNWSLDPGQEYRATCRTRVEPVCVREVVIQDFVLVELSIDHYFIKTQQLTEAFGSRVYRLDHGGKTALGHVEVTLLLRNDRDEVLRGRDALFEENV
jgi:hypothetical protein